MNRQFFAKLFGELCGKDVGVQKYGGTFNTIW